MDIGASFNTAWERFFGFLPNLLGFLVLLLVGFIVAKLVSAALRKVLERIGLDLRVRESGARKYVDMVMSGAKPSRAVGRLVFWIIFAFFLFSAVGALGIPALTTFMNDVLAYLPNIIVALLIFAIAAILAGAVAAGVSRVMGDTPTGKIAASVLPALVMIIALFMILEQLMIAEEIVRIAFAATMFAFALGLALAFGLGGRDLAGRMLEDAYRKGQEHKEQVKSDLATGRDRARTEASSTGSSSPGYSTGSFGPGSSGPTSSETTSWGTGSTTDPGSTRSWPEEPPQNRR